MEHKGGRIKEHRRQEQASGQDEWMDVEWLDEDEESAIRTENPEHVHTEREEMPDQEEPLEIEDWRAAENWNLAGGSGEDTPGAEEQQKEGSHEKPAPGQERKAERKPVRRRPDRQVAPGRVTGERVSAESGGQRPRRKRPQQGRSAGTTVRPARKKAEAGAGASGENGQRQRTDTGGKRRTQAARPVKAVGSAAGKAGRTAGKAVGRGVCIALKCGCFVAMALIVLEFWQEFWKERGTLGEIWRVAADRNYAQGIYLGIAGIVLLYGVFSALWLLGGRKMPDGNRVRTYDTGRGLTAFILFAVFVAAAGTAATFIPDSPQMLDGVKLALVVASRVRMVVLGCCAAGIVLCVIRKVIGR